MPERPIFRANDLAVEIVNGRLILLGTVTCGSETTRPTARLEVLLKPGGKANIEVLKAALEQYVGVRKLEGEELEETKGCQDGLTAIPE